MRPLYLLLIGVLGGVVATVMVQTLRPDPPDAPRPEPGGGNARFSLDEDALATIAKESLPLSLSIHGPNVTANVREDGLVELKLVYAQVSSDLPAELVFNPEIVEGDLELVEVDEAQLTDTLDMLETGLRARIAALAGDSDYDLAAITTTDHRLGFEVLVRGD